MIENVKRSGIFVGDNPFVLAQSWLDEANLTEPNDSNAIALSTVDAGGMPNARMVLLKEIEADAFVFYTNFGSAKAMEIEATGKAAFVMHWKSLRRQVRVRGEVSKVNGEQADEYFNSRSLQSRLGAWASEQSKPLESRASLMAKVAKLAISKGLHPPRPPFWGGFRIVPVEIEFWADGPHRLHDRFKWHRLHPQEDWIVERLNP